MSSDDNKQKRYEKIEFLGEGQVWHGQTSTVNDLFANLTVVQFATVYKAKDTKTDAIVAVKKV